MKPHQALLFAVTAQILLQGGALAQARALEAAPGNLEVLWLFRTDPADIGERDGWQHPGLDVSEWCELRAPGYWEPQGVTDPRPGEPPRPRNGMPYTEYDGVAWYRLHFIAPEPWAGEALELNLGTVDDEDRTYLNGVLVGQVPDRDAGVPGPGVTAASVWRRYRVAPGVLRPGEENVLAIRVTDGGGPRGPSPGADPLSRFSLVGWSQDPDGGLDWQDVATVSIGWGAYYGTEGERVEFSLTPPQAGAIAP